MYVGNAIMQSNLVLGLGTVAIATQLMDKTIPTSEVLHANKKIVEERRDFQRSVVFFSRPDFAPLAKTEIICTV
jgi:hypothetical protein